MMSQYEKTDSERDLEIRDSKWLFEVMETIISAEIFDEAAKTKNIFKSRQSKWLIDASHLSSGLHCFLCAHRQNIELRLPDSPPKTIDLIGGFFQKLLLGMPQTALDQPSKADSFKNRFRSFLRNSPKKLLNELVLLRCKFTQTSKLYGSLYNIEPRFVPHNLLRLIWNSLQFGLVRLESLGEKFHLEQQQTTHSAALRMNLKEQLEQLLTLLCPDIQFRKNLAYFLSRVIPISHLEGRADFFQYGIKCAKELKATKIFSANGFPESSMLAVFSAASKELYRAEIIGIQHGGFYGYCNVHSHAFNTEYQFLDKFVTWGWSNKSNTLGHIKPELIPIGSNHLYNVSKVKMKRKTRSRTRPKILFVEGAFYKHYIRCEHQYDFNKLKREGFTANAVVLTSLASTLNATLCLKGGQEESVEKIYFEILLDESAKKSVNAKILDRNLRAYDIYSDYDIVCFDTLGTGFLEAVSCQIPTFLLPTAAYNPIRRADVFISNLFFLESNRSYTMDYLNSLFFKAKRESETFLLNYAKPSKNDFLELQKLL